MQIEISQFLQFKHSIVYVLKVAISYNCFLTIMQHFVVKKCFYFKTPDGAASISRPSYCRAKRSSRSTYMGYLWLCSMQGHLGSFSALTMFPTFEFNDKI